MNTTRSIYSIFTLLIFTLMLGCASTTGQESAGEYVDDTVITTKVKAAFVDDPNLSAAEINVETYKGVVQLSGFVKQAEDINRATSVARAVKGVKSVKNDIRMK